ncbi:MAG: cell wall hydrolase, partial [Alphaproteobacteria bacterium]|nr:cell wall hydrolase [Alphaproteobacteria bacterium]
RQWHTAQIIARLAREGKWHPVVGKAMFFHARRVSPHWHAVEVASLGNHIFYR